MGTFNQLSGPVKYALVGALIVGVFFLAKGQFAGEEEVPPPPAAAAAPSAAPTGATAAVEESGSTGETGETGETMSPAEKRAERRKARRAELVAAAKAKGMPLPVYTALNDNKAVMIFFWNPNGQTDQHVNQAVNEVKNEHGGKVVVIKEKIANKSRYQGIAKVTEITQTPGIVMLYGTYGDAWQGYIDGVALNSRLERVLDQG